MVSISIDEANQSWLNATDNWMCPCCNRSKYEVIKTSRVGRIVAKLVRHHCHSSDAVDEFVETNQCPLGISPGHRSFIEYNIKSMSRRFFDCVICEDCNNSDAEAKKIANCDKHFSFSPLEIREFILTCPGAKHSIDKVSAINSWEKSREQFRTIMKIAEYLVIEAVNGRAWSDWNKYNNSNRTEN